MRTRTATGTGLTLIALGAILALAVRGHPSWLNIQVVGWVLILTGIVAMAFPRRGYGWLRRRMVLRRGPGGRPVVDRVEEKRYPPYIMLNPAGTGSPGRAGRGSSRAVRRRIGPRGSAPAPGAMPGTGGPPRRIQPGGITAGLNHSRPAPVRPGHRGTR